MPDSIEAQGLTVDEAIQVALNRLGVTRDRVEIEVLHNARSGFLGVGARRAKVRATVRSGFMADGDEYDMGDGQPRTRGRRRSRRGRGRGRGGKAAGAESSAEKGKSEAGGRSGQSGQGGQSGRSGPGGRGNQASQSGGRGRGSRSRRTRGGERRGGRGSEQPAATGQAAPPAAPVAAAKHDPETMRERAESLMSMMISGMGIEATVAATVNGGGEILVSIDEAEAEGLLIGRRGQTLDALEHVINRMVTRGESSGELRVVIDIGGYRQRRKTTLLDLADRLTGRAQTERRVLQVSPMSPHDRKIFEEAVSSRDGMAVRVLGTGFYRRVEVAPADLSAEEQRAGRQRARTEDIDVAEDREVEAVELSDGAEAEEAQPAPPPSEPAEAPVSDDDEDGPQPVVEGQPHALNADRHLEDEVEEEAGAEDAEDELDPNSVRAAVERYNKRLGVKVPPGGRD